MNERLLLGQSFRSSEVLSIFCDMCEAVARLHHSVSPIIHRDLKIENILIDERNRAGPPIYVLCDFGSSTTKVLSSSQYPISFLQNEVEKYTTLSYRSPEMIDLYSGKPIGTKADIWAMGIMLYKLCYFSLPFGESAMAIQNGAFSFPNEPQHSDSLKALISNIILAECAGSALEASSSPVTSFALKDGSAAPTYQTHRRNTSDTSHIIRSTWNPFLAAPFRSNQTMDDSHFGKCFDELPRKLGKELGGQSLTILVDFLLVKQALTLNMN
ncbi:unnamed protein product [Angiostrongylus costaricensis]|uniref:non-specific serine/threonine protein kinase n=1 Tax=Angiostrongylus costaricensis TaxID=334426 RepID=A0A0R3PDV3_ANGCS|nr:unnamed protein product [Angiostrongylus costaricensis]